MDDERVWTYKTGGTESRWYLRGFDSKVLREYTASSSWQIANDYIYRDSQLLASETPAGVRHYHLDHLGTPRLITDVAGTKKAFHAYYPFGQEATVVDQDAERMKFTGHERDLGDPASDADDLDYMHARFCSPVTGRFLSVDPVGGTPKIPQSLNRYAYVAGNPLRYYDPSGRVLKLAGSDELSRQAGQVANESMFGQELRISQDGNATLVSNGLQGPPTREQAAAAANFEEIIQNSSTTTVNLVSGSAAVMVGSFSTATVDLGDMQKLGSGPGFSAGAALGHEVREQYESQVLHTPDPPGSPPGYGSHLAATAVESKITGYSLGEPQLVRRLGRTDFDLSRTATKGSASVTIILEVRNLDLSRVVRP